MVYLAGFVLTFTAVRFLVVLANFAGRQWLRRGKPQSFPKISVLIPARNEEANIGHILSGLASHDYPRLEVIVYDDLSSDNTPEIVKNFASKDSRFTLLQGWELPQGWLGKNHACHRMSVHATGDYLLFLDADVDIHNGLIQNAIAHAQKYRLDLLSFFPVQIMPTWGEKMIVPMMNLILLSLLPLILTRIIPIPSLAAANGQFMLFRAEVYHREQFHKTLKKFRTEDIVISRHMKSKGYRIHTLVGNRQVQCRMYRSWDEAIRGFSRNVFEFFGGSKILGFLYAMITTFGFLAVLLAFPMVYTGLYFGVVVGLRLMVSLSSRQNVFYNLLLAPLQQLGLLYLMVKATLWQQKKATTWKGRNVD